jgi:putative acetyltransferase
VNAVIRAEAHGDAAAIRALTEQAFAGAPHSDGSEPDVVDRLRADGDLALSLVATRVGGAIVGHVAFSQVTIDGGEAGWFGLGPISVLPALQGRGIGARLVEAGLAEMRVRGARGVVLVGDPAYYSRFGFARDPRLSYPRPGGEHLQRIVLSGEGTGGTIRYAPAFG